MPDKRLLELTVDVNGETVQGREVELPRGVRTAVLELRLPEGDEEADSEAEADDDDA